MGYGVCRLLFDLGTGPLGHKVTLFASGDAKTKAKLVTTCPKALAIAVKRRLITSA